MTSKGSLLMLATLLVACRTATVRDLTKGETDYLEAVTKRVTDNGDSLKKLMTDLGTLDRQYARIERDKTVTAIAEGKLLEAMKAPWANPPQNLQATQRAVILFHLYELLEQERQRFEAEQAERDAERDVPLHTYDQLVVLLNETISNEKIVLEYLNQPPNSQIAAVVDQTLKQADAFNAELAKSKDAELQELAASAQKATDRVRQSKDAIQVVLRALTEAKK